MWGTSINLKDVMDAFKAFVEEFKPSMEAIAVRGVVTGARFRAVRVHTLYHPPPLPSFPPAGAAVAAR